MRLPTPPEIADAPELATVASVHAELELLMRVLVAANPEIGDDEPADLDHVSPLLRPALAILCTAVELQRLLDAYRDVARQLADKRFAALDDSDF